MSNDRDNIQNPQEMRRRMLEIARTGFDIDHRNDLDFTSYIIRACWNLAQHQGLSGEDFYTLLAWELRKAAQRWATQVHHNALTELPRILLPVGHAPWPMESAPMESAPKDRVIMLLMPEMFGVWASGWWRGGWSHAKQAWAIHLTVAIEGKAGMAELTGDAPQPTHWTELPPCP